MLSFHDARRMGHPLATWGVTEGNPVHDDVRAVAAATNPRYHALISAFERETGCPVVVNTSFNVRGEPIICTPENAFRCFMGTEIEALAVGNCFLRKQDKDPALELNYETTFELD